MTLHVIPMPRFVIVADRYIYLSSIGLSFIFAYYVINSYKKFGKHVKLMCFLIGAYLFYLGVYSHERTKVWYDSKTLKKEVRDFLDQRNKQPVNNAIINVVIDSVKIK